MNNIVSQREQKGHREQKGSDVTQEANRVSHKVRIGGLRRSGLFTPPGAAKLVIQGEGTPQRCFGDGTVAAVGVPTSTLSSRTSQIGLNCEEEKVER